MFISLALLASTACSTKNKNNFSYKTLKDQVYKSVDGQELKGDLYIPEYEGKKPAVLVIHGGSWGKRTGDMESLSKDLAKAGFVAFNMRYRLAPQSLYPKSVEDAKDAEGWLIAQSDKYSIDPERLFAWGYSAGGHLALMSGLDSKNKVKAIVAGGAPVDFSEWPESPSITAYIGATMKEKKEVWNEASPVNNVKADSPPVFLYNGETDSVVEPGQTRRMEVAMKKENREIEIHIVKYIGHIFTYLFSKESVEKGIDFLNRHGSGL